MSLDFVNQTPVSAFRRLERDLRLVNPKLDMNRYKAMSVHRLEEKIGKIDSKVRVWKETAVYGSWLRDPKFVELTMLREALDILVEYKRDQIEQEVLVPGYTYYRGVKQFGPMLSGKKCFFMGESQGKPAWIDFEIPMAVAKAFEVLKFGNEENFRRIYLEMADGRVDGFSRVSLEHLTESSKEALRDIEAYCDAQWDGPWPWEATAPLKIREMIEEGKAMKAKTLTEMQGKFGKLLAQLREGEMEQYEVVNMAREMAAQVDKMIADLGKISSAGIEASASARSIIGDNAGDQLSQALNEPVNQAAQALSTLKSAIEKSISTLEGGAGDDLGGDMGGDLGGLGGDDDLGSPADAMGGDDLPSDLADVNLDGDDEERPLKDM